ncbi:hypothetical protein HHI36_014373 [Cryptolaemus montrouzieri]|uniref:39S ribosomal protein L12, mitochondrial n=1 Tax=Cryptolaemus montrouzieri TaxID=559131 RepID=A0ABD2N3M2_9CUCU
MQSARILCLHYCAKRTSFVSLTPASLLKIKVATTATSTSAPPPVEKLTIPPPSTSDKPVSQKIEKLFDDISKLNLIEVSELSDLLKKRLNLSDISAVAVSPVTAPSEEDEAAPVKTKTNFTVKLMKFDEKQKVALIKEIKSLMEGMNLVQAKKFVEGAPAVVKADIGKEEADKLKEVIEKAGGVVQVD